MITVRGLQKVFVSANQRVTAVSGIDFHVERGTFFTLLGPSGCGKTTTLRMLAGLERPTSGHIKIGERVVFSSADRTHVPPNRRSVGMVFQSYAIWPHMTVLQNVTYPLIAGPKVARARNKQECRERAMEALRLVGLEDLAGRPAPRLSGGQQQRVALARALVREPDVLLLDEPLSNLDARLRDQMRDEIKRVQARVGITTVFVTHDQDEALSMSDQVAVMDQGHILQVGSPREIYNEPRHQFTAQFIGSVNLLEGRLSAASDASGEPDVVETAIGRLVVRRKLQARLGDAVTVMVRPEALRISQRARSEQPNTFSGRVERVAFFGDHTRIEVKVGSIRLLAVGSDLDGLSSGSEVAIHVEAARCVIMNEHAATGPDLGSDPGDEAIDDRPAVSISDGVLPGE